jgi:hypothetical protein
MPKGKKQISRQLGKLPQALNYRTWIDFCRRRWPETVGKNRRGVAVASANLFQPRGSVSVQVLSVPFTD